MFYDLALYSALGIFALGVIYKISSWFRLRVGFEAVRFSPSQRVLAALRGTVLTLFSRKVLVLLRVLVLDVLLQVRVLREDRLRWIMHMCLFWGFLLLVLMHGLEPLVADELFSDYASTLNPFLFLRNLFTALVLVGLVLAAVRRFVFKVPHLMTGGADRTLMILLAVVLVSGILLEAVKITSYSEYQSMVEDFAAVDEQEAEALEAFWVEQFRVVSPNRSGPFDEELLAQGREVHEMNCAACHSPPQWAFLSYAAAEASRPVALTLDRADVPLMLWYLHFLISLAGLAYLPFSKMFHMLASPLSLLANAVMDPSHSDPANIATRRVMELDACTHCGACTLACSVGVCFDDIPNVNILPSEKLTALKAMASGKDLTEQETKLLQEGLYLCTNCYRCTAVCPVGINLQELWFSVRERLLLGGPAELLVYSPFSLYRGLRRDELLQDSYAAPIEAVSRRLEMLRRPEVSGAAPLNVSQLDKTYKKKLATSIEGKSFSACFTCTTCTTACPVVRTYESPAESLDLVPHQIMRASSVGLTDLIFGSRMLWSCLGCYQCQENCPQGIRVADVLYELKNLAAERIDAGQESSGEER